MYDENEVVVIRQILCVSRDVTGTENVGHQPRVGDEGAVVQVLGNDLREVECVSASGNTMWLATFHVDELAPALVDWEFAVTGASAGCYRATGSGPRNMRVESTDGDPDKVLADRREFALRYPR